MILLLLICNQIRSSRANILMSRLAESGVHWTQRRKPKTEEKYPKLLVDIQELMEPECHADPHLRTTLAYTDKTAASVCDALVAKGWSPEIVPSVRTMSDILMRLGYPEERTVVYSTHNATDIYEGVGALPLKPEAGSRPAQQHLEGIKQIIHDFIKEP